MSEQPVAKSYWAAAASCPQRRPPAGDLRVDVAVVGAGITGLTAAMLLLEAGKSVAVMIAGQARFSPLAYAYSLAGLSCGAVAGMLMSDIVLGRDNAKDDAGKVTSLSSVCRHMGCVARWNSAEKTWDCPCHGSRFDANGRVVMGPAKVPLEQREIKPSRACLDKGERR